MKLLHGEFVENVIEFKQGEMFEIPSILSHISIMVNGDKFSVKTEVGLEEEVTHITSKEELIAYLGRILWN